MNAITYTPRYPSWDRFRPMLLKISLSISIVICLAVFNLETVASEITPIDYEPIEEIFTMETPATIHKKKKVIPPVPSEPIKPKEKIPTKIVVVDKIEKTTVEEKLFVDVEQEVKSTGPVESPVAAVAPKVEIPIIEEPVEKIHSIVEQMPVFGDCSLDDYDRAAVRRCSDQSLLQFIHKHLKYPQLARENDIEGTAVIQFVVDKEGKVTNVKIVRGEEGGLGMAAKKVIASLPQWKPGKQNGRPVKVLYTVPVKFNLD